MGGTEQIRGLHMKSKLIYKTFISLFIMALFLFIPVGTFNWPSAWIFLIIQGGGELGIGFWLAKNDPDLLKERLSSVIQKQQNKLDKIIMIIFSFFQIVWLPFIAVDVALHQFDSFPLFVKIIATILIIMAFYIFYLTFKENTYASPVVKIQKVRAHKIITTGPYSYVRHPMYFGSILYFIGIPLLLGSWHGLLFTVLLTMLLIIRALLEEKVLTEKLNSNYIEYTKQVRYRIVPCIW